MFNTQKVMITYLYLPVTRVVFACKQNTILTACFCRQKYSY